MDEINDMSELIGDVPQSPTPSWLEQGHGEVLFNRCKECGRAIPYPQLPAHDPLCNAVDYELLRQRLGNVKYDWKLTRPQLIERGSYPQVQMALFVGDFCVPITLTKAEWTGGNRDKIFIQRRTRAALQILDWIASGKSAKEANQDALAYVKPDPITSIQGDC